jgi:Sulfotransferase domain
MPDDFVTVVSGLPRSGTSLMMQMLEAGGLPLLTDGLRVADEHNPRGYFEHEQVKHSRTDLSWLESANSKAVKVIHVLLLHLPASRNYRVIFMLRDIGEVINSQRVMLQKQGRAAAVLTDAKLGGIFETQVSSVRRWLAEQPNFRVLYLNHREVIENSPVATGQINDFLGGNLQVERMVAAVNPELYRQRNKG